MNIHSEQSKPLVIFELANNHFGSVQHAKFVIEKFSKVLSLKQFQFAIKFQYRDLDSFIHEDFKNRYDIKYVKRFMETKLQDEDFLELKDYCKSLGFKTICTPFDEESVRKVISQNFDYLKIASASFTDWPLLEQVVKHDIPVIASTAGANSVDLRKSVSFLSKRVKNLTLMHCVAKYPTLDTELRLDRIDYLRSCFNNLRIGYSAHESPNNFDAVKVAYAKGARVFEKHIGVETDLYKNNEYSCSIEQIEKWLESLINSMKFCGFEVDSPDLLELETLNSLRRGAYAGKDLMAGQKILDSEIFFAMPTTDDQLLANDWSKLVNWEVLQKISKGQPILKHKLKRTSQDKKVEEIALRAKDMCARAGVVLPNMANFEVSHHYGLENFEKFGLVMVTVVNRNYCKKILVISPGQTNPEHLHELKEESFYCLYGEVRLEIESEVLSLKPGDLALIPAGKKHTIHSSTGAVVEEISSTSTVLDSFYTDPRIADNKFRKSNIVLWS